MLVAGALSSAREFFSAAAHPARARRPARALSVA